MAVLVSLAAGLLSWWVRETHLISISVRRCQVDVHLNRAVHNITGTFVLDTEVDPLLRLRSLHLFVLVHACRLRVDMNAASTILITYGIDWLALRREGTGAVFSDSWPCGHSLVTRETSLSCIAPETLLLNKDLVASAYYR